MSTSYELLPENLLAEQDWVLRILQHLVRDEASARDVLQSTWLRVLRHPPRAERGSLGWRSWFARVARNLALRGGERASARQERELLSARVECVPSAAEIVEREELRARVLAHVLALAEPYRSTLLLRYYEGLEPGTIAREQSINGSTVRNRIARGLRLLREQLVPHNARNRSGARVGLQPHATSQSCPSINDKVNDVHNRGEPCAQAESFSSSFSWRSCSGRPSQAPRLLGRRWHDRKPICASANSPQSPRSGPTRPPPDAMETSPSSSIQQTSKMAGAHMAPAVRRSTAL